MKTTNCQRCGKEIERRGNRKYCTQCREIVDDERYKSHRKESKDDKIKKLSEENRILKNMINTTIGIAYDKDDFDAIEYLVHERDGSECFTLKDIKDGKTERKGNDND